MTCPPEIADILLAIIRVGVLRIRSGAWAGNCNDCAHDADHIHNLPDLLLNYSPESLSFYWDVERPAFLSRAGSTADLSEFRPLWDRLAIHVLGDPVTR